ncbi:DUF1761 domain-containing protein [Enterococcus sp. BWB1-3]|uniref:DUF1761 domain-containing protein n=1 Tax=unclassified Enterococcus TaxID=2608891 RepID=UPI001922F9CF|nr:MULTISPECIES: DUF1761 domain-containing protein [unclassified Enterococcus]MBL1229585.1 DUF1761 domain-containing protein [Enterococcus sp. BWB1-3]MCB5955963.1 DUF1761 domain-containing protein [Enterococcus sp. CWB-B31]
MNILAIISAGILAFGVGALWYTVLFGKTWRKELGITEEQVEEGDSGFFPMLLSLLIEIVIAFLVIYTISKLQLPVFTSGLLISSIAVFSALKNYIFEQKSLTLILINEGYKTVCIMIMAAFFYFFG